MMNLNKKMLLWLLFSMLALQLFPASTWEPLTFTGPTPPGRAGQMVYDNQNCCIVLFGGRYNSGQYDNLNDTWIYHEVEGVFQWENVTAQSAQTPSARRSFSIAYDDNRGVVVMYGGEEGYSQTKDDLWEWSYHTKQWTPITPESTHNPQSLGGQMMVYDASLGEVIMFSGYSIETRNWNNLMWRWNGKRWKEVNQGAEKPEPGASQGMVYHQANQQIILFGGAVNGYPADKTWIWSWSHYDQPDEDDPADREAKGTWKHEDVPGPSARWSPLMVYDEVNKETILFGGWDTSRFYNDTWTWNGVSWQEEFPATVPGSRVGCAAAFSKSSNSIVMFGGWDGTNWLDDTWEYAVTIPPSTPSQSIPIAERYGLLNFFNASAGTGWTDNSNWAGPEGSENNWFGVSTATINCEFRVYSIDLKFNNLHGSFPAQMPGWSMLRYFSLKGNNIGGGIPAWMGSLPQLELLDLTNNTNLGGFIPAELGELENLRTLALSGCALEGTIPEQLDDLTGLQQLALANNNLTGAIPDLSHLNNLWNINLGNNQLTGSLGDWLGNLTALEELKLYYNSGLTGPVPEIILNLPHLRLLDIRGTALTLTEEMEQALLNKGVTIKK